MKIAVYAIATTEKECYGHGEYADEVAIRQQNSYGSGQAFFHPLFLSIEKAKEYVISLGPLWEYCVVTLELDINSASIDIDATEIIEDETKNKWKAAIMDYLVCTFLLNDENKNDPKRALRDIVGREVQLALDPAVSEKANKLLEMRPEDYKNS